MTTPMYCYSPSLHVRALLVVAAISMFTQIGAASPAMAAELEQPPKLIGLATADFPDDLETYEAEVGLSPAFRQLFWTLESDWATRKPTDLDATESVGAYVYAEITTSDPAGLRQGSKDAVLTDMVDLVGAWLDADAARKVVIAPLPEANLVDFVWGADPAGYKAGYERIRNAFRDAGLGPDQVRFVFAMHGTSSPGFSMADFYPGDDVVDIIGFSIINRNNPWHDYDSAFQRFIDEIKGTISQSKPILVTQTASVVEGQDRASWLRDMFNNLGAESQAVGIIYFNRAKTEGGKYNDYRVLTDGWIDPTFRDGAKAWASPGGVSWLFDGRMDRWVADREEAFGGTPYFRDIGSSPFELDILWLASEGITQGCNPPTSDLFCPDSTVTRGQMAAFLVRALDLPAVVGVDTFGDDDDSVFEADIERLAAAGVTAGCNPPANDLYCPTSTVTRGQMAAFLARALG